MKMARNDKPPGLSRFQLHIFVWTGERIQGDQAQARQPIKKESRADFEPITETLQMWGSKGTLSLQ